MRTVINHACVLTMDKEFHTFEDGYVVIEDENIVEAGEGPGPENADCIIHGKGGILMPGMVNVHSHISMIPFRSMGDDCPDRLRKFLFPLELKAMTPGLVYQSARYAICELLLAGVTSVTDMYYFEDQVARACEEMGIRAWVGETIIHMETCDSKEPYGGLKICEELIKKWRHHDRIHPIVAPHATNTNSPEVLKAAYDLARKYNTKYTLHVSEMDYEMELFARDYGKTPIEFLYDLGVLGEDTIAVHCIHAAHKDVDILAETGTKVAHCVAANAKAGKGISPVYDMRKKGISVGVGTDGPSSGNTLDLFTQLRMIPSLQKTRYHNRSIMTAREVVSMGTIEGARVLGAEREIGSIEPGKRADLVLISTEGVNMFPFYNPYSVLVYSANPSNVDSVWVSGRRLVENHMLMGANLEAERHRLKNEMVEFTAYAKNDIDNL